MSTATIDNTRPALLRTVVRDTGLEVRLLKLASCQGAFLAAEAVLFALAAADWIGGGHAPGALVLMACCGLFLHLNGIPQSVVAMDGPQFSIDLIECLSLGFLTTALLFALFPGLVCPAGITLSAALAFGGLPVILRVCLGRFFRRGGFFQDVLVLGSGDLVSRVDDAVKVAAGAPNGLGPLASFGCADASSSSIDSQIHHLLTNNRVSRVVVAERDFRVRARLAAALIGWRLSGVRVCDVVDFCEELSGKLWLDALSPEWLVYTAGFRQSRASAVLRRCFDVVFSSLVILLVLPLLLLIVIAIKCDSEGPVLFKQVRVGLHGKSFVIYKFRSMRVDAERDSGPTWAAARDHRVTRVGRLLRLFRLDELPQVINVLKGEMSIIGPRPERPCFVDQLREQIPFYDLRHYLKPGITGWAQVMYQYGASVEDTCEKLQYDLYYAKHQSFGCDLAILLKTVRIVLFGRGR